MKKSEAKTEFSRSYKLFTEAISKILYFKLEMPGMLEYLKLEESITIKRHIVHGGLTEAQIKANEFELNRKLKAIDEHPKIIYSMSFIYIVAAFEVFLKDSIKILIRFNVDILKKSEKKISYSELFQFANYGELESFVSDKIVNELGYKTISEQIKFLNEKIHIGLSFKRKKGIVANRKFIDLEIITEIFSTRNILLHNGGIINKRYLDANPSSKYNLGHEIEFSREYLIEVWSEIRHNAEAIYRQSMKHIKNKTCI